jgi:hypothetical protein
MIAPSSKLSQMMQKRAKCTFLSCVHKIQQIPRIAEVDSYDLDEFRGVRE